MSAERILDINQARAVFLRRLVVEVRAQQAANGFVQSLAMALTPFRVAADGAQVEAGTAGPAAGCPVWVDYMRAGARAQIALGPQWRVEPTDELLQRLAELAGQEQVKLVY